MKGMSWKRLSPYLPIGGVVVATLLVSQCKVDKLIGPPTGGVLTLSPLSLSDSAQLGSRGARTQQLIVGNGATGRITWTATTTHGSAWLHLGAATGTAPDTLPLTFVPTGLALGTYRDTVVVTGSGSSEGELRVPVQFTVQPCTVTPTTVGSQVTGTLGAASCGAPHRSDHPAALFSFSGSIGDSVSLELTAPAGYLVFDSTTTLSKPSYAESGTCGSSGNPCLFYQRLPRTGSYVVEVTTNTATDSGAYTLTLSPPRVPVAPSALAQLQSDSATVVNTGDTVSQSAIVLRGVVSDPDRPDSLRLEVEAKPTSIAFTGTGTTIGAAVKNGLPALVRVTGLADDSSYHWRARAVDQTGRVGPWLAYGGNAETVADFVLGNSLAQPAALGQFKSDNVTLLAVGATNATRTLIFKGLVTDPTQGQFVRLEVEYQSVGTAFTNVAKVSSPLSPPGDTVAATSTSLADNVTYHWQAREVSQSGRTSGWASFGGNAESAADFKEALTPQQLVFVASPTADTAGAPIHPTVQVAARDSLGNTLASFHDSIAITIDSNPGGATLSGTTKVAAVAGIATFPGLSLNKSGVGYRLRATLAYPALTVPSGLFNVSSGTISNSLSTVVAAPATIHASTGDSVSTITVTVKDPLGNRVPNVSVILSDTATGDSLRQPVTTTDSLGVTTGAVSSRLVGVKTIKAAAGGQALTQVATVTVLAAHAQNLTFTVQPTSASAGATITPAIQVTARDSLGNVDTSYAGLVTLAIGTNPGGATLGGTKTVAAAHGVATFGDLSLDKTGTGYTLTASGASVAVGATSASFNIGAGTGTKLAFTVEPSSAVAGTAIAPAIEVTAQDASNNTVTSFTGTVTLSLAANPGSDTLHGTVSVAAVGGKATFSSVLLHHVGAGYTLSAAATGFSTATSTTFNVRPGSATKLAFTTEPAGASAGATLPATVVTAQDAFGNTDTSNALVVTATIDSNPSGGVLNGTTGVAAVHGVTTFSTLTIDKAGVGYRLAATATGLTQARSTPFNITAGAVSAVKSTLVALPATIAAGGVGSTISVTARDSLGNPVSGAGVVIASTGTGNTITQPAGATDSTGLATGSFTSTKAESKTVSVTVGGVLLNQTAAVTVNPAPISASHSLLSAAPASIAAGGGISVITATARDAFNNPIAGLTVTLAATGSGNTVTEPPSPTDASGAASGALSSTATGAKIISATIGGVGVTQTDTVTVISGGATHLVFSVEPTTATAGVGIAPTVHVSALDANNNVSTAFTGSISLAIGTNPGGGTLLGTTSKSATAGVATFPGIRIDPAGAGYTLTASASGVAGATSTAFNIVAAPPASLGVASQPSAAAVNGVAFAQQPAIQIQDSVGNPVSQSCTTITAGLGSGAGTLGGTLTAVTGAGGLAAFTNLKITGLVGSRALAFTASGLTGVSSGTVVVSAGAATQIAVNGGNHQAATAGTAVGAPPQVLVTDQSGNPVSGVGVTFALPGSASANGSLTGPNPSTNTSGIATVGSWTLGTTAKPDSMTATSTGLTGSPLTFVDTAKVGVPAHLAKFSGDSLVGPVGTRLATPHDALVTDANGNPVPGVAVAWAAVGGGSVDSATSHTDANGHAVMNRTLGSTPGGETTTATVASLTPASFSVTAQVGGATQMALNGGDLQKDTVGHLLPVALSVIVKDALNNAVPGVAISWAVLNGGGTIDSATSHTNGSGIASAHWTLGTAMSPVDSTQLVQATGVGSPVTFTAFTVPDAVSSSQTSVTATSPITASSGSSQSTITVTARDQYGNVIKGKTLTLGATGTGNTITNPASPTNTNGVTTGTLSSTAAESKTVTATVGGVVIAQQPSVVVNPAAAASLSFIQQPTGVVAGAAITPAITVEILDAFSNLVTAASNPVTLTIAANPGSATLSGSVTNVAAVSGVATFANASLNKSGTGYTLAAASTGLTGTTSGAFNVSSGAVSAAQSTVSATSPITAGGAASTVTVTARDANGNPIVGATVVLAATGSGNTLTQPGVVTDATGVATGSLASTVAESKTVSAKINGVDITQTPAVVVNPGAAQSVALNGGGAQSATVATAVTIPPSMIVKDINNNPVPGVGVTFAVTGGGGVVVPTTPVLSNAAGVATVTSWTLGNTAGTNTLTATAAVPSGSPVTITATGTPGAATHFAFTQEPTGAASGATITPAIVVSALDAHDNVDPTFTGGITLSIANNAGGGALSGTTTVAATQGVSQFTDISIDKVGTGYTLTASNTGPTPATSAAFNITPGAATHLSFTQQPTSAASGASVAPAVTVTALDAHENVVTTFANPITLAIA
ncbi:MAG TPA: Ig-like domain-containing protein, partial [Gemmatimonadales bacterium]|nr:Ig-like domain-containing protein [Gemmatimonadales bacterium]